MRYSRAFIPTLKEVPGDAVVASHVLMLRAGMIRKVAAGVYNYLPLGWRVLQKVSRIVREEMDRAGAIEVNMPASIPAELWQETGRWDQFGAELLRFKDRKGGDFCVGPTHEEVITDMVRKEVRSYRELPLNLYQIQSKFRDELRPRFGLMRGREFIMKDAYSFDIDEAAAKQSYELMFEAYNRIFKRCGLEFRAVFADTGAIGGDLSHEFQVLADSGEDTILSSDASDYAANVELCAIGGGDDVALAEVPEGAPEPAVVETPDQRTIEEVSAFLDLPPERMLKTLVYLADEEPVVAVVRGDHEVGEVKLRKAAGASSLVLADDDTVEKVTGAPRGFAGPRGLKGVRIFADHAVKQVQDAAAGANAKDAHVTHLWAARDFDAAYIDLRVAAPGDASPAGDGGTLVAHRGIEVGHVFFLGDKYSKAMKATVLDENGKAQTMVMGCYGIGIGRTAAAAIEQNHDDNGIIWPAPLAPYQVHLLWLQPKAPVVEATDKLYDDLQDAGFEVLYDDRKERTGVKFKDADLLGFPIRVAIGGRGLERGVAEVKLRRDDEVLEVPLGEVVQKVGELLQVELDRAKV